METMTEFTERLGVTMTAEPATHNPNMGDPIPDAAHWTCTLKHGDRELSVPYSMGPAHKTVTRQAMLVFRGVIPEGWKTGERMPMTLGGRSLDVTEAEKRCKPTEPDLPGVLDCLASDAASIENARCFEDWASEYGYDDDSRKAHTIYEVCQKQAAELARFIGEADFQALLFETERE